MILDQVAAGDDRAAGEVQGADFEVVHVFATAALEVVVMAEAGALVAGLAIGEDDGPDAVGLEKEIEGSVDGGDPKAPEGGLGALKDLLDRYGTLGVSDGLEDGIALAGMTLAKRGGHEAKVREGGGFSIFDFRNSLALTRGHGRHTPVAVPEKCKAMGKWLMVLSLCAAVGLHWAALQSVAWAGMLLNYSRSGSVGSAIVKTFDGRHPCPLCNAIAKGEQGGKKQEYQGSGKIDMDYPRQAALLIPPLHDFSWPAFGPEASGYSPQPSVPPPRAA